MHAILVEADDHNDSPPGPDALVWREVPDPAPGPDEVLIKVRAAGVNRADLMQRQGHYPPPPGASTIIGLECSGTIAALGDGVAGWTVGDDCVALLAGGAYAEQVVVPAGQVFAPPAGIDLVAAAGLVEVAATVVSNLDVVGLVAGETLLVHGGAGGIGSFAIGWAKHLGASVITTAGSPEKLEHCRRLGADHALSYRDDWVAAVSEIGPVDVILDPVGAKYLSDHVQLLARGGRLVVIGLQGGRRGELDLAALLARNGSVHATGLRGRPIEEKAAICRRLAADVWPLFSDGTIALTPYETVPLADAARAHARLESGEVLGKVVLAVDS
ncbi:MAG: NAD(P)H-quinone oxidoreductase [Propionibacteriales bacterium]|nr:NAD(P)H-quinone oxidoreductase [Propionibacteriales bacterium]